MPRRRSRHRYTLARPVKVAKYSNETFSFARDLGFNGGQTSWVLVTQSSQVLGTRKCKNFTLTCTTSANFPFLFVLVFLPEGTNPSDLSVGTSIVGNFLVASSLYEPSQNVILQGIINGNQSGATRFKTRLARNLNSGDRIVLGIKPIIQYQDTVDVIGTINYAISY